MTASEKQTIDRWRDLIRDVSHAITEFQADYVLSRPMDPVAPGRRLEPFYRRPRTNPSSATARPVTHSTDDPGSHDAIVVRREHLTRKRQRWVALWCKTADMIAAYEAEYAGSPADDKVWAQRSADRLRARLHRLRSELHAIHSDMPEIDELELDATGKHRVKVSAMDVLEAIYFGLYADEENDEDDARWMTDVERARWTKDGREFRALLDSMASVSDSDS